MGHYPLTPRTEVELRFGLRQVADLQPDRGEVEPRLGLEPGAVQTTRIEDRLLIVRDGVAQLTGRADTWSRGSSAVDSTQVIPDVAGVLDGAEVPLARGLQIAAGLMDHREVVGDFGQAQQVLAGSIEVLCLLEQGSRLIQVPPRVGDEPAQVRHVGPRLEPGADVLGSLELSELEERVRLRQERGGEVDSLQHRQCWPELSQHHQELTLQTAVVDVRLLAIRELLEQSDRLAELARRGEVACCSTQGLGRPRPGLSGETSGAQRPSAACIEVRLGGRPVALRGAFGLPALLEMEGDLGRRRSQRSQDVGDSLAGAPSVAPRVVQRRDT